MNGWGPAHDDRFAPEEPQAKSSIWPLLARLPGAEIDGSRRHRILVGLVAVLVPLGVAVTALTAVIGGGGFLAPGPLIGAVATAGLVGAYCIAVRGATRLASWLATLIAFAGCVGALLFSAALPQPAAYAFFAVPIAMSSLLLPAAATAALTVLTIAASPLLSAPWITRGALAIVAAMVGGLLTVGSHFRNQDQAQIRSQNRRLETTQTWLREAQRISSVGAFTWTPGQRLWWSPEVYRVLGYEPGEIEPSFDTFRDHIHPDDREAFDDRIENALEGRTSDPFHCRIEKADGTTAHTVWNAETVTGTDGRSRYVGAVQDVTGRKRYEKVQRKVAGEQARTQALGEVVEIASHEFREPIRTAFTSIQLIERELDAAERERLAGPIWSAKAANLRLRRITDALVTFTECLARPLEFERVDLHDVLEDAVQEVRDELDDGFTIEQGSLPEVHADRDFLATVLEELVSNAVHHGGSKLAVDAEHRDGAWEIAVRDDGEGIPADLQERAFEPFERLGRDGWSKHPGLGLPLVRRIVERHGGTVEARLRSDGGTEIALTIPDLDPGEKEAKAVPRAQTAGSQEAEA